MKLFEVLELARADLANSAPTHAHYPEARERHAKARRAIQAAIDVLYEEHNFEVTPEVEEA